MCTDGALSCQEQTRNTRKWNNQKLSFSKLCSKCNVTSVYSVGNTFSHSERRLTQCNRNAWTIWFHWGHQLWHLMRKWGVLCHGCHLVSQWWRMGQVPFLFQALVFSCHVSCNLLNPPSRFPHQKLAGRGDSGTTVSGCPSVYVSALSSTF